MSYSHDSYASSAEVNRFTRGNQVKIRLGGMGKLANSHAHSVAEEVGFGVCAVVVAKDDQVVIQNKEGREVSVPAFWLESV